MKKIYQKVEKHAVNLLNKNVSVATMLWIFIGLIVVSIVAFNHKTKYNYIDMNNQTGISYKCYETKRDILCEIPISVKQYYKD